MCWPELLTMVALWPLHPNSTQNHVFFMGDRPHCPPWNQPSPNTHQLHGLYTQNPTRNHVFFKRNRPHCPSWKSTKSKHAHRAHVVKSWLRPTATKYHKTLASSGSSTAALAQTQDFTSSGKSWPNRFKTQDFYLVRQKSWSNLSNTKDHSCLVRLKLSLVLDHKELLRIRSDSVTRQKTCLASLHRSLLWTPILRQSHHWYND